MLYAYTECCCCCCFCSALCVAILLLLRQQQQCCCFLLLLVLVCRMAKVVAGSCNLIPVFSFSSFKRNINFDCTPWQYSVAFTASICLVRTYLEVLGNYGHARSQGGRQPAGANPPLNRLLFSTSNPLLIGDSRRKKLEKKKKKIPA